jgi:hypothetical protein
VTQEQFQELERNEAIIYRAFLQDELADAFRYFAQREMDRYAELSIGQTLAGQPHNAVVAAAKLAGIDEFWAALKDAARHYQDRTTSGA